MKWLRRLLGFKQCILVIAYRDNPDVPIIKTFHSRDEMTRWISINIPHDEPPKPWMYFWEYSWIGGKYRHIGTGERK